MNTFRIYETYNKIEKSKLLFEQYKMALNWEKYDIEVRNDDAINCNQICFISCN